VYGRSSGGFDSSASGKFVRLNQIDGVLAGSTSHHGFDQHLANTGALVIDAYGGDHQVAVLRPGPTFVIHECDVRGHGDELTAVLGHDNHPSLIDGLRIIPPSDEATNDLRDLCQPR